MRTRAYRRAKTQSKMWRRLKEDRNEHYDDLTCPCWTSPKHMARFKEQPKTWSCYCCSSPRYGWGSADQRLTLQELRFLAIKVDDEE